MFLLGFLDNFVAMIAQDLGLWQFHLMRTVLAVGVLGALALLGHAQLRPKRRWAVAVRGGFAAFAMLIYFGCLGFLPIGQVAAGLFTAPIWVMLISAVFLGQPVGLTRITAALIGFAGVLIVLNPFENGVNTVALVPMTAGFFYAIGGIATRQWCDGESALSMLLYFFLALGVFGLIGTLGAAATSGELTCRIGGVFVAWPCMAHATWAWSDGAASHRFADRGWAGFQSLSAWGCCAGRHIRIFTFGFRSRLEFCAVRRSDPGPGYFGNGIDCRFGHCHFTALAPVLNSR